MATAETARLIASLELQDKNFTRGLAKVEKGVGRVDKKLSAVGGFVNRNLGRAIDSLALKGVEAIGGTIKVAADFEAQLNTINTVARATPEQLGKIGEQIRNIARTTGTGIDELTQGYYDLVSAGISAADAQGVLEASNTLAIGGLASTAETVDLLTTAINAYGFEASEAGRLSDIFAKSIERGKVTAADIGNTFANVGPLAASYKVEVEEIAAAYAQLSAQGFTAGDVTTQFRSALVALAKPTTGLKKLQKETGRSYLKIAGRKGLVEALELMRADADKAGVPITDLLGRVEALNFFTATTGGNLAEYNENLAEMGNASGTAAAQMAERQKGLNFQIARLRALAQDAGITIGSKLIPKLIPLADELAEFLNRPATQLQIGELGDQLASALGEAATFAKSIPWNSVADAMRLAGTGARAALDLFKSMPGWVQTAVLTGWGLNKITGGALTGLLSGVIKGVLGMNAAVVNINAATVNGLPGGGVAGAAGKGGGRLAGVGKLALGLTGVGLAAALADEFGDEIIGLGKDMGRGWREAVENAVGVKLPDINANEIEWPFGPKNTPTILPEVFGGNGLLGGTAAAAAPVRGGDRPSPGNPGLVKGQLKDAVSAGTAGVTSAVKNAQSIASRENSAQKAELGNVKNAVTTLTAQQKAAAVAAAATAVLQGTLQAARDALQTAAVRTGSQQQTSATRTAGSNVATAMSVAASRIVGAVNALDLSVNVTTVQRTTTVNNRYGPSGGSATTNRTYSGQ